MFWSCSTFTATKRSNKTKHIHVLNWEFWELVLFYKTGWMDVKTILKTLVPKAVCEFANINHTSCSLLRALVWKWVHGQCNYSKSHDRLTAERFLSVKGGAPSNASLQQQLHSLTKTVQPSCTAHREWVKSQFRVVSLSKTALSLH